MSQLKPSGQGSFPNAAPTVALETLWASATSSNGHGPQKRKFQPEEESEEPDRKRRFAYCPVCHSIGDSRFTGLDGRNLHIGNKACIATAKRRGLRIPDSFEGLESLNTWSNLQEYSEMFNWGVTEEFSAFRTMFATPGAGPSNHGTHEDGGSHTAGPLERKYFSGRLFFDTPIVPQTLPQQQQQQQQHRPTRLSRATSLLHPKLAAHREPALAGGRQLQPSASFPPFEADARQSYEASKTPMLTVREQLTHPGPATDTEATIIEKEARLRRTFDALQAQLPDVPVMPLPRASSQSHSAGEGGGSGSDASTTRRAKNQRRPRNIALALAPTPTLQTAPGGDSQAKTIAIASRAKMDTPPPPPPAQDGVHPQASDFDLHSDFRVQGVRYIPRESAQHTAILPLPAQQLQMEGGTQSQTPDCEPQDKRFEPIGTSSKRINTSSPPTQPHKQHQQQQKDIAQTEPSSDDFDFSDFQVQGVQFVPSDWDQFFASALRGEYVPDSSWPLDQAGHYKWEDNFFQDVGAGSGVTPESEKGTEDTVVGGLSGGGNGATAAGTSDGVSTPGEEVVEESYENTVGDQGGYLHGGERRFPDEIEEQIAAILQGNQPSPSLESFV